MNSKNHIDKLACTQKRAIRVVTYSRYNAHTEPLFKHLNMLMVTYIIRLQQLKFYHTYINGNLPEYFSRLGIRENEDVHTHYTRNRHDIHVERANTELARKPLRFNIVRVINNTPTLIINKIQSHSLQDFSSYAKNIFLSQYSSSCNIRNCYICHLYDN